MRLLLLNLRRPLLPRLLVLPLPLRSLSPRSNRATLRTLSTIITMPLLLARVVQVLLVVPSTTTISLLTPMLTLSVTRMLTRVTTLEDKKDSPQIVSR